MVACSFSSSDVVFAFRDLVFFLTKTENGTMVNGKRVSGAGLEKCFI